MRQPGFALLAALWLLVVAVGPAETTSAHAILLRSIPSSRQQLQQAPDQVRLLFSEPINPLFSSMHVFDAAGQPVDRSDSHVDDADDHQLVASLQPGLPTGVLTVSWRSLSTIDVHPDTGQFRLFVGVPVTADTSSMATTGQTSATPETTISRWWFYLAASVFGGVLAIWKLVLSSVLTGPHEVWRASVRSRARRAIAIGGVALLFGTLFAAVAQAAAAADVPFFAALGQPVSDLLLRGRFAAIWWPRLALELASILLIAFGGLEGLAADCALATLPAVLLTSSLTSHAAALEAGVGPAILIDWLHILSATLWVGGLLSVLIVLPAVRPSSGGGFDGRLLARLVSRFARFALAAAILVTLSGTAQAILEVSSFSSLVGTEYGQLILVKVALLTAMLLLALFNDRRGRRPAQSGPSGADGLRGIRVGVRAELALGIVVFAVAAVLSGTPPSRQPSASRLANQAATTALASQP